MASPLALPTDGSNDGHAAFWTPLLDSVAADFHVRQPWLSPPAVAGTSVAADPLPPPTAALIDELGGGQDLGALVIVAGAAAWLLHLHTQAAVVTIDSPPLAAGDDGEAMVPLFLAVDPAETVRQFLTRVSATIAGSYSYQSLPIASFSERVRGKARPATNVSIAFEGLHRAVPAGASHDLQITVTRGPAIGIRLDGRAPAFSAGFLPGFARHLVHVLEGFRNREATLDEIDVLGDEERTRLLVHYNAGRAVVAPAATIPHLFEARARSAGAGVAIQLGDVAVTCDALNRQANQLARFLQTEYGIARGDVVGVVSHRSPAAIAGLLGVLKAGAVYLPIDPDYPEERLRFMVDDAGVKVLLVHAEHFDRLTALYETPMFALDLQLETLETGADDLEPACAPDDLAYIIYTSGSTGQPKAVLLEHRGFVAMVQHHIEAFGVGPSDRLLQFYGHSFDSSLFEIFVALLSGATLVMVDRETIGDPAQLSAYVEAQQVTMLTLPPVYLGTLDRERLSSVRIYVSAGDHCRVDDAVRLARTSDYYNSYGPTETSVCVTHHRVDPERPYGSRIPIGTPIAGTSIYLLDERLRPTPEGVAGEICVAGVSVARGYLNREALTGEKFLPSPFAAGERMYRTGDLGVWLPDGNLEVIGRKDNQVKVRGYRIELGEIEAVLDQHPQVRESAVLAREDDHGHRRLVAFVTGVPAAAVADLRTLLQARLPEFMLPSAFIVLDRMPLTANGKIDRQALAGLGEPSAAPDPSAGRPTTPAEETLVRIWADVLGAPHVGIHDNLFDLGGDSILIIQIVSRAREAGLKLVPNQLFDHQTIAALAGVAVAAPAAAAAVIEQDAIEGPAPLAPMQAWFFEQRFADPHHFNQSVCLAAGAPGDTAPAAPAETIDAAAAAAATQAVLAHHDALRLRFTEQGGRWTAEYAPVSAETPFDVVDLSGVSPDRLEQEVRAAVAACHSGFDLSSGPLVRVRLLRLGADRPDRLVFVAHHLVIDGVSWRLLLGDFSTAYTQISRGEAVALPAKTTSFRAWTTGLAALSSSLDAAYWRGRDFMAMPLPTDRPRTASANTVASAGEISRTLDAEVTTALLQEVPKAYATEINTVLLAGLAMTLQAWTGSGRVLIDLEAHGREELLDEADTSRTVGWFTAQFPMAIDVGADAAPDRVIKSVKEQLRAVPLRGAGYGVLRYLSNEPAMAAELVQQPAPEVLFNYFGQAGRVLAPGLRWGLLPGSTGGDSSPRNARPHLLEITGMITDGCLTLTWTFSEALHDRRTVEDLASRYERDLRLLVAQSRAVAGPQHTPSDFPDSGLDQQALDTLLARFTR